MIKEVEMMDVDIAEDSRLKVVSWIAAFVAGVVFWLLVYKLISCTFLA